MNRKLIMFVALAAVLSLWGFGCGKAAPPAPIGLSAPVEMVEIPAGEFMMGSPETEEGRGDDETQHPVKITYAFQMGKTEVTQKQWHEVVGTTIQQQRDTEFCKQLTKLEGAVGRLPAGHEYRLPTEAEWEYACRAGSTTRFFNGDTEAELDKIGWYGSNSSSITHPVGTKLPNSWGLHDMHGNVWEWCLDWSGDDSAEKSIDPFGSATGPFRVDRGGSWRSPSRNCRSADRGGFAPGIRSSFLGFRVVLAPVRPR